MISCIVFAMFIVIAFIAWHHGYYIAQNHCYKNLMEFAEELTTPYKEDIAQLRKERDELQSMIDQRVQDDEES